MFAQNMYEKEMDHGRVETLIGYGVKVEGTLESKGNITIDGFFKGTLKVGAKLTVGKDAVVEAGVEAHDIFCAGKILGNVNSVERCELSASAIIEGDISAGVLVVEAGANLKGACNVVPKKSINMAPMAKKEESEKVSSK